MKAVLKNHTSTGFFIGGTGAAVVLAAVVIILCGARESDVPRRALSHGLYIWQRSWNDAMSPAIKQAAGSAGAFYVLAGEVEIKNGQITGTLFDTDWAAAAGGGIPVVPVIRAGDAITPLMRKDPNAVSESFGELLRKAQQRAGAAGCTLSGVQIDYDAPTSNLKAYREFISAFRRQHTALDVSITALPTWLDSPDFPALTRETSWYVLQVHGVERPSTMDQPVVLCDYGRVGAWVSRAEKIGQDFAVALPTYGYRVAFDPAGRFSKFVAESAAALPAGFSEKLVAADPARVAEVVRGISDSLPSRCRGFLWFRMPVEGNELNWDWNTLAACMRGEAVAPRVAAEVRQPEPGLYEVWLRNEGGRIPGTARIPMDFAGAQIIASDIFHGCRKDGAAGLVVPLTGMQRENLVAWYRVSQGNDPAVAPKAGPVRIEQ